jgi:uncharacterized glyoxalase superfamily protein PhnB
MPIIPLLDVTNYDESVRFYTEKLGFNSDFTMQGPDGSNDFGFVSFGEGIQFGLGRGDTVGERGTGVEISIYPEGDFNIDEYYEQVQANGATIEREIKSEYWGDRVFVVRDPDGYRLMFGQQERELSMDEIQEYMRDAANFAEMS